MDPVARTGRSQTLDSNSGVFSGGGHCAYVRPLQSSGKLDLFGLPSVFTCIGGALGTPPAERGPSLESIYRVSLAVDLCEYNKIIRPSLKKIILPQPVMGPLKKKKKSGGPVLTGLSIGRSRPIDITSLMRLTSDQTVANHNENGHSIDHHDLILLVYHCASCS